MDETIDLRPYLEALLRWWWVILGAVIAGVLVAAFLYFYQSTYQANALVAVTDPTQQLQFDSRIVNTLNLDVLMEAYPEMAASDDVLAVVLKQAEQLPDSTISTLSELRNHIKVETAANYRLVRLIVNHDDPQIAADLVNTWANAFVAVADKVYLGQSGEVEFYQSKLADTNLELQAVEKALVDFQSGSRISIVDNQLLSLNEQQVSYLTDQRRLTQLLDDMSALSNQIAAGTNDTVIWADQLTALVLQMKVYNSLPAPSSSDSIQLQVNSQVDLTTSNRTEQLSLLTNLAQSVKTTLGELEVKLLQLEPRIFELQREREILSQQYDELVRNRDVAKETATTLSRRIDEVRIQAEDTGNSLRIASLAAVPTKPHRLNLPLAAAVAGMAGLLISVATILLQTWWKSTGNEPAA